MVLTGLDILAQEGFARLRGRPVGLVTHAAAVDRRVRQATDLLAAAEGVDLALAMPTRRAARSRTRDSRATCRPLAHERLEPRMATPPPASGRRRRNWQASARS